MKPAVSLSVPKRRVLLPTSALFVIGVLIVCCSAVGGEPIVSVVTDSTLGGAAEYGAKKLLAALGDSGITAERVKSLDAARGTLLVIAGLADGNGAAAKLLKAGNKAIPQGPEALVICKSQYQGKPCWVIGGSDDRGLMYGELDVADRIGWSTDRDQPLERTRRRQSEKPAVTTRAVSIYTMNRAYWESRFYDEAYWARYLDTLAQNRFNSLVVDLRLRKRRLPRAVLSLLLRCRGFSRRADGGHQSRPATAA